MALSTKIPRVGGWIIGLHHDPTLENPATGIWLAVVWDKTRYPLRSGYQVFSHCSTVLQGVSVNFSLQHSSAASIFSKVGVEYLVWENGVKYEILDSDRQSDGSLCV